MKKLRVICLAVALMTCGMTAAAQQLGMSAMPEECNMKSLKSNVMVVHPHECLPDGIDEREFKTVFLAGTIDMGNSIDWQTQIADYFATLSGKYILYNPRQEHWDATKEGEMDYQVNWELEHLEKPDVIIMNFLPNSQSPITLLELGLFAKSRKIFVCCPKAFYRYDNIRITCRRYCVPLYDNLQDLLKVVF